MKEKLISFIGQAKTYWRKPPEGRYMSFREIASLSVGGIGARIIVWCIAQMIIATGNTLIGNTIGIDPGALYAIYIISLITAFPLTALRSEMIDNTRNMKGKYRPYILTMGLPTVILGALFIWMPYENMTLFGKCATVLGFNIGFQFFYSFFNDAYDSLINVLSPNSIERSDVLSIKSVVENISPSIANIIFPILAKAITGENTLYDMKIFRILFPPILFGGFLLSLIIYCNTEEKIVQARSHFIHIKFTDAFRAVARNKYFWIISLAGWLGFLESAFANVLQWTYNYQGACTAGQYSLITAIVGNASFWPNLIAPFFIRKYGKKKILVFTNLLNIGCIAVMLPVIRMTGSKGMIWLLVGCVFINTLITALGHLLTPGINADIRDYQQYMTGERIDGMFAAVGLIGNIVTMATSLVLPMIYERTGLNQQTAVSLGYDGRNVYDVLYNKDYFISICTVLIIASVIGAAMNVIPYFFYDFTETKQAAIVRILKLRAVFEDRANGIISEEKEAEAEKILHETAEYTGKTMLDLKEEKAAAKALPRSERRKTMKEKRAYNENIAIADAVKKELGKYDTPEGEALYERAASLYAAGLGGFMDTALPTKEQAKRLPRATQTEKDARRDTLLLIRDMNTAKKTAAEFYPDGITEFDMTVFDKLFRAEDENEAAITEVSRRIKAAKESKNKDGLAADKDELRRLKTVKKEIRAELKKATNQNSVYHKAAKPYLDAKKTVEQRENYYAVKETV